MCTAMLGATPVYLCTWAASSAFSNGVRGTPGWANTLNRVPLFPNAHDGSSIWCRLSALLTAALRAGSRSLILAFRIISVLVKEFHTPPGPLLFEAAGLRGGGRGRQP